MDVRRRWNRGLVGLDIGMLLSVGATVLSAQIASAPASLTWTQWLQNFANLTKVVEIAVFIFSGYQFWAGRRDRNQADIEAAEQARIDSIYQAWQVINSAQGKGGSGGRIEALRDLLRNKISLAGINLDGAWLEGVQLPGATLMRGSLQNANLSQADLSAANLEGVDMRHAILVTANLAGANLRGANLAGARLSAATLDGADLTGVLGWTEVTSISYASVEGVRNIEELPLQLDSEHDDERRRYYRLTTLGFAVARAEAARLAALVDAAARRKLLGRSRRGAR